MLRKYTSQQKIKNQRNVGFVCNRFFLKYPETALRIILERTAFIRW